MRIRRFVMVALVAACFVPFVRDPAPAAHAQITIPYAVASESYYRVDTANGRISVSIHGEFQNMQSRDLLTLPIYVMPGAENIVVRAGDQILESVITPGNETAAVAGWATATLPRPLKYNTRIVLDATYDIAPRTGGKFMTLESGMVETPFVGQGPGSFVLVDVPEAGDNYFDPGCLLATDQPKDVKAAGFARWVCGEVTIIALNGDDPDVLRKCASMDVKCRQRAEVSVFSAYVQSITDLSKAGKLEVDLAMGDGRSVRMVLKYFKRDQVWADKQFGIAQAAFPRLEALFGYPYPHPQLTMRQSHHIENIGAAGVAFSKVGEVLLATDTGVDDEVTIHELAHQWASRGMHFELSFMSEGLAEYGMRAIAPELGVTPHDWGWQRFTFQEPLSSWNNGSSIFNSQYWYGRSGAFWFAYEAAIGGREAMTAVLGRIDDEKALWRLDAGWFMDQGEWVSGKNLDALFLEWVFHPVTSKTLIAERRTAHDQVRELQARAATMGLGGMPSDIYDNLLAWVYGPVAGQVAKAHKVLDAYAEVVALSTEAGLGTPDGVGKAWGKRRISETLVVVEEQRQAITAILHATRELESASPDSVALRRLAEAREKYDAGDFAGAKSAAAGGVTAAFNEVAATRMIEIAKEKQKDFSPNFLARIGMFFTDPKADLASAEQALADGDGTKALELSKGAYETWDGATKRGIQRLALVAGVMCGLTFLVWFLLRRLDGPVAPAKRPGQGHFLEEAGDRRASWRDWENSQ